MRGGFISVGALFVGVCGWLCADGCDAVHAEPGDDKITFANDVAGWLLARSSVGTDGLEETRPKL